MLYTYSVYVSVCEKHHMATDFRLVKSDHTTTLIPK